MNIVLVLIPLSLVLVALGAWAFFWSVDHDQFDDLDTPALIPLSDETAVAQPRAAPAHHASASEMPAHDENDAASPQSPDGTNEPRLTSHLSHPTRP